LFISVSFLFFRRILYAPSRRRMQAELRHGRLSAIMAAMNLLPHCAWPFNPNFPNVISLVELANDKGLLGQALRQYKQFLSAAEKWAEQDYEYQERHEDPKRLPMTDPWSYLLKLRDVPGTHRAIFRAAQSQLPALRRLIRMAEGVATLKTDWYQVAIEARDRGEKWAYHYAMSKVAAERALNPLVQKDVQAQNDPELVKQMELVQNDRRRQLIKRGKRDELERPKMSSWREYRNSSTVPVLLVESWVRLGINGLPGLMFWRNEAIADFLQLRLGRTETDLPPAETKKVRQRLGLIPASKNNHFVWSIRNKQNPEEKRIVEGLQRNGALAFKDTMPSG
jgi:hypothetical protein